MRVSSLHCVWAEESVCTRRKMVSTSDTNNITLPCRVVGYQTISMTG